MMPANPLFQRYSTQLALLLAITGICFMVSGVAMVLLGQLIFHTPMEQLGNEMMRPENANMSRLINTAITVISFGLPPIIFAKILGKQPFLRLGFHGRINRQQLGWVVLIALASVGLSGMLAEFNQQIPMPKEWHLKAKAMELAYEKTVMAMAHMPRFIDFLLALLTVAVAPAILEELMFRSGLQPIFIGITKSPFWGILITSLLFSAIHFSIYGFIPRTALGFLLGLVYYYGRNIWLSIFFHFFNNALVVLALFWASRNGKPASEVINEKIPWIWGLVSLAAIIFLLRYFIQASRRYWNETPSLFKMNMEQDA
jgi:membrane protease YdiL (CAAX protease family)